MASDVRLPHEHQAPNGNDAVVRPNTAARTEPIRSVRCRSLWRAAILALLSCRADPRTALSYRA